MSKKKRLPDPKLLKRPLAEVDLDEIWFYIAQDNPAAANRFLDKIEELCRTLAQFPHMGRGREELHPDLRSLPIGKHLIF